MAASRRIERAERGDTGKDGLLTKKRGAGKPDSSLDELPAR
jgi:hypothetical protein